MSDPENHDPVHKAHPTSRDPVGPSAPEAPLPERGADPVSLSNYRVIFDLHDDMLFLVENDRILVRNSSAKLGLEEMGITKDPARFSDLMTGPHRERITDVFHAISRGKTSSGYLVASFAVQGGGIHHMEISVKALDPRPGRFLVICRDINRVEASHQRIVFENRMHLLRQVAAGIAHEINTPLASMNLLADNVDRRIEDEGVKEKMEVLRKLVHQVSTSIDGLLDISRLNGDMTRIVDICSIVEELAGEYSDLPYLLERGIAVIPDVPHGAVWFRGDAVEMKRALGKLLVNSADASDRGAKIRIRVVSEEENARIEVVDRGMGMDRDQLARATELFYTTRKAPGGSGLGLPLAESIISDHGGTMLIDSRPGKGTTVSVILPRVIYRESTTGGDDPVDTLRDS